MTFDIEWEAQHRAQRWGIWPDENLVRFVARNYGRSPDRRRVHFLDLGCGAGGNSRFLAEEGYSTTGVDGSATAIKRCNEWRMEREQETAERAADFFASPVFYRRDITLAFIESGLDCVIDICTVQHLSPVGRIDVITNAAKALKPGGRIFSIMQRVGTAPDLGSPKTPSRVFSSTDIRRLYQKHFRFELYPHEYTRPHPTLGGERQTIKHWLLEGVKR